MRNLLANLYLNVTPLKTYVYSNETLIYSCDSKLFPSHSSIVPSNSTNSNLGYKGYKQVMDLSITLNFSELNEFLGQVLHNATKNLPQIHRISKYLNLKISLPLSLTEVEIEAISDILVALGYFNFKIIPASLITLASNLIKSSNNKTVGLLYIAYETAYLISFNSNEVNLAVRLKFNAREYLNNLTKALQESFNLTTSQFDLWDVLVNYQPSMQIQGKDISSNLPKKIILDKNFMQTTINAANKELNLELINLIKQYDYEVITPAISNLYVYTPVNALIFNYKLPSSEFDLIACINKETLPILKISNKLLRSWEYLTSNYR